MARLTGTEEVPRGERQPQPQHERPPGVAAAPPATVRLASTIGNRAMCRLLDRASAAPPARNVARTPTQVTKALREERSGGKAPIGWTAAYQVEFRPSGCWLDVNAKIVPDAGVTEAQTAAVKAQTSTEFMRIWDRRFELTEHGTTNRHLVRVRINYVDSGEHVTIQLHPGSGHDNRRNWFVNSSALDRAHEVGHQIGQLDEYVDPEVINRATATSPGVFTDNSIMGNYPAEGPARAEAKLRHGEALAAQIGTAMGKTYDVRLVPLAERDAADAAAAAAAAAAVGRAIERAAAGVRAWFD